MRVVIYSVCLLLATALGACKKNWTCSCQVTTVEKGKAAVVENRDYRILKAKQKAAVNACAYTYTENRDMRGNLVSTVTNNCALK